jgi:hypothetical protein
VGSVRTELVEVDLDRCFGCGKRMPWLWRHAPRWIARSVRRDLWLELLLHGWLCSQELWAARRSSGLDATCPTCGAPDYQGSFTCGHEMTEAEAEIVRQQWDIDAAKGHEPRSCA